MRCGLLRCPQLHRLHFSTRTTSRPSCASALSHVSVARILGSTVAWRILASRQHVTAMATALSRAAQCGIHEEDVHPRESRVRFTRGRVSGCSPQAYTKMKHPRDLVARREDRRRRLQSARSLRQSVLLEIQRKTQSPTQNSRHYLHLGPCWSLITC